VDVEKEGSSFEAHIGSQKGREFGTRLPPQLSLLLLEDYQIGQAVSC
jgi:hypothetical protein